MRKAQIGIQFNWIFILIIGAVVLAFFLVVIRSQTKSADIDLASDIIANLDTVIKSSENTPGSLSIIRIPDSKINFVCEDGISFYDLGGGVSKDIPYDIIFSQKELIGNELISWTQSWNLPFRMGLFQYLTTKRAQFLIVEDSEFSDELFDLLPGNLSKKMIPENYDDLDEGFDYYKIIAFSDKVYSGNLHMGDDVHLITITIDTNNLDSHGTIDFDGAPPTKFIKIESLLGAIFAEDAEFYKCTMKKAFTRMKILIELNNNRTEQIKDEVTDPRCVSFYQLASNDLKNMPTDLDSSDSIFGIAEKLARTNQLLIRGRNCPRIY